MTEEPEKMLVQHWIPPNVGSKNRMFDCRSERTISNAPVKTGSVNSNIAAVNANAQGRIRYA